MPIVYVTLDLAIKNAPVIPLILLFKNAYMK